MTNMTKVREQGVKLVATEKAGAMRAFVAAEAYGISVEVFKQLKLMQTVEVPSEIAARLVTDGYAKEVGNGN